MSVITTAFQRIQDHVLAMAPKTAHGTAISPSVASPAKLHLPAGEETLAAAVRDGEAGAELTNVAIFSYKPGVEAHRLFEELSTRGVRPHILDIGGVRQAADGAFTYNGKAMPQLDGAIMYDGAMGPASGPATLDALKSKGTFISQDGDALRLSRDKILTKERFSERGVPQADYVVLEDDAAIERAGRELFSSGLVGPRGIIVKEAVGTHGEGVAKVTDRTKLADKVSEMRESDPRLLAEELVNAHGRDLRIVVGKEAPGDELRVLTAIQRTSRKRGEFRANVALGGSVTAVKPTAAQSEAAINAAKALGMDFGGVDVFQNQSLLGYVRNRLTGWEPTPKVIEVNSGPDSSEAIGNDVYGVLANYVAEGAQQVRATRSAANPGRAAAAS